MRPGPAAVVAVLALALAIAGGAGALPGRNSVNSGDIRAGAVKRSDHAKSQRTEWAIVELDLTPRILKQSGGIRLEADSGNGYATLRFPRVVSGRIPLAQNTSGGGPPARAAICGGGEAGMICGAPYDTFPTRHVYVATQTPATASTVNVTLLPK